MAWGGVSVHNSINFSASAYYVHHKFLHGQRALCAGKTVADMLCSPNPIPKLTHLVSPNNTHTHTHTHTHVHTYIHTCIHIYIHTYIHTHTRTLAHMYLSAHSLTLTHLSLSLVEHALLSALSPTRVKRNTARQPTDSTWNRNVRS